MNALRTMIPSLLPFLLGLTTLAPVAFAQTDPEQMERLRRDQDEILRKAERLQTLMQKLQQRYERENKPEQVKLLRDGLAHLDRSGILRDVASIRDDIAATALTEALRKQKEVVDDLERLLNILLERKSVENLDQELKVVAEQARSARELEQRQRELMEQTQQTMRTPPSPAEQQLLDGLKSLRDGERREAERNQRQAGSRRPFLENALERVREMLQGQQRLEQGVADEAAGKTPKARAQEFDLGDLAERTRELQADLRDQAGQESLGTAAKELQKEAAGTDQAALQQARDRLQAGLQKPPKRGSGSEGKEQDKAWQELREQLQTAANGATAAEREQLAKLAETGTKLAEQRSQEAKTANSAAAEKLEKDAAQLSEQLRASQASGDAKNDPAAAVAQAQQKLAEAAAASKNDDVATAQQKVNEALSALDRARAQHQQQNPDAGRKASEMAAEASSTAQELHNAPSAAAAEQKASEQLRAAEQALRKVEANEPTDQTPPTAANAERQQAAGEARQNLQAAEKTLQEALQEASQDSQPEMQAAAERQEQLQQAAKQAAEQLQQAAEQNQVTKAQAEKAAAKLQQAQQRMQNAAQKLQSGQQANAAGEQQAAAEAVQEAMQALDENRPPDAAQKEQLQQQAKAQEKLAEDIIRLAEELKKRDNKAAEQKANQAAAAAKKAQRAMEQGEPEEAQQQQEEARKNLEDAAKELEQEEDRYQDLRQEELLFRMKDELTQFLTKQVPISAQTLEAQKTAPADGLSRAVRRKVNQLGEEEQELAGKLAFLVKALTEEGNLVYQAVLTANCEDLKEVARRLGGRNPDVGTFTTLLQEDVVRRTEEMLKALERERQRRDEERKKKQEEQQQQKDPGKNRFDPQRQKLVSLIAELELLKQLGVDTRRATDNLRTLVEARGDEVISDAEVAMIERLAHRHNEITKLFQQIKAGVEETLQGMQGNEGEEGGRGR